MILANAGVPMLALELPVFVIALVPIVLLEAWLYVRMCKVKWPTAWRAAAWANSYSTLIGVPLAWFVQVVLLVVAQATSDAGSAWEIEHPVLRLGAVALQSAWLSPHESELDWMIPAAALFLLLPAFAITVPCELLVLRAWFTELPSRQLRTSALRANMASYCLLAAFWGAILCRGIVAPS